MDQMNSRYQLVKCLWHLIYFIIAFPPALWLSLSAVDQTSIKCSIEDFYVAGFQNNSVIYFDLKLKNEAPVMGAYYDNINLTFSYVIGDPQFPSAIFPIAIYTIPGFHQGIDKTTNRRDYVVTYVFSWSEVSKKGSSKEIYRVDLESVVRFKDLFWMTKRKNLVVWNNVEVDGTSGKKIEKKSIELKYVNGRKWWVWLSIVICGLAIFFLPYVCFILFAVAWDRFR